MTITFSAILFALFILFKGLQKNIFFLFYAASMIFTAYLLENNFEWNFFPFGKICLLWFILFHFLFVNLFTFLAYGRDKYLARHGEWRIPEIHLHTLELLGGTIGAVLGQKIFHHKNKKRSYLVIFWAAVIIQIGIIFAILRYFHFI